MTIELTAMIRTAVPLSDALAHVEATIARLLRTPPAERLVVERAAKPLGDIILGPYPIDLTQPHPWSFLGWDADDLHISFGSSAKVALSVGYRPSDRDLGISMEHLSEEQRAAHFEQTGYYALISAGICRTRPSFCLAVLLAHSIATLSRSRILDDEGRLRRKEIVEPQTIAEELARHGNADSFESLAERVCDALGFRIGR